MRWTPILLCGAVLVACTDQTATEPDPLLAGRAAASVQGNGPDATGVVTANGWYEGEEIYYINQGIEEGVTARGGNDIYLIGDDRLHQAQLVEFIPGEAGYTPHWNVNVVHTAEGVTVADILASPFASAHYPEALFDDVEDILNAQAAGLVMIEKPGVVVLCPIISEQGAEAPGNTQLPEDEFEPFGETF